MTHFAELIEGYRRFYEMSWQAQRARWEKLSEGQQPRTMVIACSDSRADPAQIFDTSPGEIFTVRNVAALVPPFETGGGYHGVSAALEFSVTQLEVEEILVMGHGKCGGCHAALHNHFDDAEPGQGGFIGHWIDLLDDARERVLSRHSEINEAALNAMEHEGVKVSLANLMTFPFVAERVKSGKLLLHGAWFAISSGLLHVYDRESDEFSPA